MYYTCFFNAFDFCRFADGQTLTNKRNYSFGSDVQAVQDAKYPVQDLTVDDAVTKAITNSNTIKTLKGI